MINFKNKNVAVIGLGIEGKDVIDYLLTNEAMVSLLDKKTETELDFTGIDRQNIGVLAGPDYLKTLNDYDYIIRSPGVYRFSPELMAAEKRGVIITSAINLFFENCPAKIIGVTGTKGKGTTSTLIYEILKSAGKNVYLSGNIGKPYLGLLPRLTKDSWVVMEMSSFQLIDLTISPHISVVLNITSDHLDWHKDINEYIDAKMNIVKNQSKHDFAVINEDYKTSKEFSKFTNAKIIFFSKYKLDSKYKKNLLLRGEHNLENIAAAVEVAKVIGIEENIILNVVSGFKGLEHRLELVRNVNGRAFYNDSFATGPQPTIAAINSFTEPETLILGGSGKGLDYSELGKVIISKNNIENIILIGQTGSKIFNTFKGSPFKGAVYDLGFSGMEDIVKKAYEVTKKGGVVLLSPASASFDMFKNYKDRGNQFKEAVYKLNEK